MPIIGKLRYAFTGGKGGVGKTVLAAALAYDKAADGKETLLVSLNPVHSLSNLFNQNFKGGKIAKVEGVDNLYAVEVEIDDIVKSYKERMATRLREFFKWAEVPINPDPFIDIATTNPAFQEAAMFDKVMDIIIEESGKYDAIIFDTAAVANAVRLIGLSKLYGLWLARMIESRREALQLRYKLSVRKDKVMEEIKKDPILNDLLALNQKFSETRKILTNPNMTGFYFVTIPQALSISVVKRFIKMVTGFDIPMGGVFVNMVLDKEEVARDDTGYLKSRYEEQARYIKDIKESMGEYVRGYVRLYERDITGIEDIKRVVEDIYSFEPEV